MIEAAIEAAASPGRGTSRRAIAATLGLALLAPVVAADLRLPRILGDGVVLQRESDVTLWGWADPGAEVTVAPSWSSEEPVTTTVDPEGRWRLAVRTPEAGGPHSIAIESTGAGPAVEISDVLVGEVWVCGGQSNMEWTLGPGVGPGVANWEAELEEAYYPALRLFDVDSVYTAAPRHDCRGAWKETDPENARAFSAVAYFFGREVHLSLDVPVGLISTNWGGTVAEAWTSEETLSSWPYFADELERVREAARDPAGVAARFEAEWGEYWAALAERDAGSGEAAWMRAGDAGASWSEMELPQSWEDAGLDFDGVVWFRRTVELSDELAAGELVLRLGAIDDMDTTWFNGERIGGMELSGMHRRQRVYPIPAGLARAGENTIAVRVLDTGGAGGIHGGPDELSIGPAGAPAAERLSLAGPWRFETGATLEDVGAPPAPFTLHQNRPTVLYNGMLAPILPFGIRGAVWYQGESNRARYEQYRTLFPAMIADWRRSFGQGDFPFYFVQIAPFAYGGDRGEAALLREAQTLALTVPNTGMAVTMDIGDPRDIHPANKQDVGERLALLALGRTYGHDVADSGPMYREMAVEGDGIRLHFDHAEGGLASGGAELAHFTIAGADRVFHPATATIDGETVLVRSDAVAEPVAVRFGWAADAMTNLWNQDGLPAPSFRTDNWDLEP